MEANSVERGVWKYICIYFIEMETPWNYLTGGKRCEKIRLEGRYVGADDMLGRYVGTEVWTVPLCNAANVAVSC